MPSLEKIHRRIEQDKMFRKLSKEAEMRIIPRVKATYLVAFIKCLHDEFGFGLKRLTKLLSKVDEHFDCLYEKYVTMEDLKKMIVNELGIDIDEIEKQDVAERVKNAADKDN